MKKTFSVLLFLLFITCSFGQDVTTLLKLNDYSISLGSSDSAYIDTFLIKARVKRLNTKTAEQLVYLSRAAEHYSNKDYENAKLNIQRVRMNFHYPEYNNLKFLLFIGTYANLKDLKNSAKHFYIVYRSKDLTPYTLKTIRGIIRNNFTKEAFSDELSYYFYYHERLKIIDEIDFYE